MQAKRKSFYANCLTVFVRVLQTLVRRRTFFYSDFIVNCHYVWIKSLVLTIFTRESSMLRASLPSSGRLSVRLSHSWSVSKRIIKSSLWAAPRSPVYRDKISYHWVQGFPSNEGVEEGYPLKRRHFAVIGLNNVKTVADRFIHAAYHNKHWWQVFWIYQHRWPWTTLNPSKRGF